MSNYQIRPIDAGANNAMLEILRGSPIVTNLMTICFDRQPDIFALPGYKYDDYFYQGLFEGETLKGFGMIGYHKALVNGTTSEVFCARDLYILPEARGNKFLAKSTEIHFRENQHRSPIGYGLIMNGNTASLRFVGNRPEDNHYSPLSKIINKMHIYTIFLTLPLSHGHHYKIRRAQAEDIPVIARLLQFEHRDRLFGNICTEETFSAALKKKGLSIRDYFLAFDRTGQCCGVCAAWDMTTMKQTRVLHFGRKFLPVQMAYTTLSVLFNRPSLPGPGEHFREATITDYAVRDRDPGIMHALLRAVYNEFRQLGYHFLTWGSSSDDPLLKAANGFMRQRVVSNIVLFSTNCEWLEEGAVKNHLPYIDVSAI
jgi:hypothetical protein